MNNKIRYIARIHENEKHSEIEFDSLKLPRTLYFFLTVDSHFSHLYHEITKVELIEKSNGTKKIIRTRRLTKNDRNIE